MKLPISFEEVAYFKNEYRGDLIITSGILYYFPHTRVNYARYSEEIGGKNSMVLFDLLGTFFPIIGTVPILRLAVDKSIKAGKFLKRTFRPSINSSRMKKNHLWNEDDKKLQIILDKYIEKTKQQKLNFEEDSIPRPMRFSVGEVENARFGLKFEFDAKFDSHDFRVNLIHRSLVRKALQEAGFIN